MTPRRCHMARHLPQRIQLEDAMKKTLAVACLLLMVHSLPILAEDQPPIPPPIAVVSTVLQLNDAQLHALVMMIQLRDAATQPLAEELQRHGREIERLLGTPDADPAALGRLLIEARGLNAEIGEIRRNAAVPFEQVLTFDQANRLRQIREAAPLQDVLPAFAATGLI
jgi:hypothetical protein